MARSGVKRLVFGLAVACFVGAAAVLAGMVWVIASLGITHIAAASLFASTLFLISCGVVLVVMSQPRRPPDNEPGSSA